MQEFQTIFAGSAGDIFNPTNWEAHLADHEFRIYGDDMAQIYSVVDQIDYQWCLQWMWSPKFSRGGNKFYLRRGIQIGFGRNMVQSTRFLHTEIMLRTGIKPRSSKHRLVDHRDGDGMNCRRGNLRWATDGMNRVNVYGSNSNDMMEG